MEIRAREVLLAELEFANAKGKRRIMSIQRGSELFKHCMYVETPVGGLDNYTDEELELLLRLTERLDRRWRDWRASGTDLFYGDRYMVFGKNLSRNGAVVDWTCRRGSWREGLTKPTLAQAISRFYMGDLFSRGMWVCGLDLVACQVMTGEGNKDQIELLNRDGMFSWCDFVLAAPTKVELDELYDLYRRERVAMGLKAYPATLNPAG